MSKLMFKVPEGFKIPEGVTEGKSFEVYGTVKLYPNGKMCLTEVDGNPITAFADKEDGEEVAKTSTSYGSSVMGEEANASE